MTNWFKALHQFLFRPFRVLAICLVIGFCSLLFSGNFIRLFQVHRDRGLILGQMMTLGTQISGLEYQLKMAKDPSYIERQALDLYDLVDEHDLVFVFADE